MHTYLELTFDEMIIFTKMKTVDFSVIFFCFVKLVSHFIFKSMLSLRNVFNVIGTL